MAGTWYSLFVLVNGVWECAKDGTMSKSAAEGLYQQFAQQYKVRLFRGYHAGKLVKSNA